MKKNRINKKQVSATRQQPPKIKNEIAPSNQGSLKKASLGFSGFNFGSSLGSLNIPNMKNSYASGLGTGVGALGDVPQYFALMNENNGGILYWPVSIKEKYEWFRYFSRADPFVKRAVEYNTDLPMSKIILRMPKLEDDELREKIRLKYENMVKRLKLFDRLHSILFEMNVLGNAFAFSEFDEVNKEWSKIVILPPEEVVISKYPMSDTAKVQYRPEMLNSIMGKYSVPVNTEEDYQEFVANLPTEEKECFSSIPYEMAKQLIENNGVIIMDTDPFSGDGEGQVGSFVYHFSEKRHDYFELGTSPLECVLVPLLMKEHFKYTQLSLASRNMTPRNKITAPGVSKEDLEALREEVDMSMLNPDYSIVTNFDWGWEQMGAENRLIDLSREYETIEKQLFAGLGVNEELMTGGTMYSGSKISVELFNTRCLLKREILTRFVEECLFLPMAEENGFYTVDKWGGKKYLYPHLSFSRLSIRDNAEVFDSLFQLYQKGSIPVDIILDLFNLDSDEIHEKLRQDMFTVKDSRYNDLLGNIYDNISSTIAEETNVKELVVKYMKGPQGEEIKSVDNAPEEEEEEEDMERDFEPRRSEKKEMPSKAEVREEVEETETGPEKESSVNAVDEFIMKRMPRKPEPEVPDLVEDILL